MKTLSNTFSNTHATRRVSQATGSLSQIAFVCLLLIGVSLTACQKNEAKTAADEMKNRTSIMNADLSKNYRHDGLSQATLDELQQVKQATAKYRDFNNAIKDGYADIKVVVPHMGYHYLKLDYLDATFEVRKPEILVYAKNPQNNHMELVAAEYAVPIPLSPNAPPQGFTGDNDVWFYDTQFNLWTLHAWVWAFNPDGVFKPTNPTVAE